jgi:hypothetical protein
MRTRRDGLGQGASEPERPPEPGLAQWLEVEEARVSARRRARPRAQSVTAAEAEGDVKSETNAPAAGRRIMDVTNELEILTRPIDCLDRQGKPGITARL